MSKLIAFRLPDGLVGPFEEKSAVSGGKSAVLVDLVSGWLGEDVCAAKEEADIGAILNPAPLEPEFSHAPLAEQLDPAFFE